MEMGVCCQNSAPKGKKGKISDIAACIIFATTIALRVGSILELNDPRDAPRPLSSKEMPEPRPSLGQLLLHFCNRSFENNVKSPRRV
jgi:hypothetical protein